METRYYQVVGTTTTQGVLGAVIRPGFVFKGILGDDGRVRLVADNRSSGPAPGWETPRQVVEIDQAAYAGGCAKGMDLLPELDRLDKVVAASGTKP